MVTPRRDDVAALLRRRVLAGLRTGALARGARLPSTRELSGRLDVDPRVVLAAYRDLAEENLVELRTRSGIFVAADAPLGGRPGAPAESWLVDVLAEGVRREVPATELVEWLRRAVETVRLRAAVVAATTDQREGIAAELRADFGLDADVAGPAALDDAAALPPELGRADVLVTTEALEPRLRPIAERLGTPLVLAAVRPDLVGDEWRRLLQQTVWVVVRDRRFGDLVREYVRAVAAAAELRILEVGQDDVGAIPEDAPVYVTRSARDALGDRRVPGRLLPTARTLSPESSRELLAVVVRANLAAAAPHEGGDAWRR